MHRYLLSFGILALLVPQWGCDEGGSDSTEPDEVVSVTPTTSSGPSDQSTPAPPGEGGGRTEGEVDMIHDVATPEKVEEKVPEDDSLKKMNEIGEAMLAYHQKYNTFPPARYFGKGEKPLLSWRVLLLPYLDEGRLFDRFKKDEPWDSEHNRPLADEMPDVFKTPDGPKSPETCYLVARGLGTVFSAKEGVNSASIKDGLENTILVVEADMDHSVKWSAPDDLQFVQATPSSGLGNFREGMFLALTADGVAHRLPAGLNADLMRALFTAGAGDTANVAALELKPGDLEAAPGSLLGQAKRAMLDLREEGGLRLLMAEALVRDNEQVLGSLRWSPALKRPVLICRWGVALHTTMNLSKENLDILTRACGDPVTEPLQKRIAKDEFGEWFAELAEVNEDVSLLVPKEDERAKPSAGPKRDPGIVMWGQVAPDQIKGLFQKEKVDVALVARLSPMSFPGGRIQPALTFRLYDVRRNVRLYESKSLRVAQVVMAIRFGESAVNPIDELLEDLMYYVDANVRLISIPDLTKSWVQNRARELVGQHEDPLPALLELRYYAWRNLISPGELASCYSLLVGEKDGMILATGNEEQRLEVVKQWLTK